MTVTRMLDEMPSSEFTDWIAYSQIEPHGGGAESKPSGAGEQTLAEQKQIVRMYHEIFTDQHAKGLI